MAKEDTEETKETTTKEETTKDTSGDTSSTDTKKSDTSSDSNSSTSASGDEYKVGDYGIFSDGISTAKAFSSAVNDSLTVLSNNANKIGDDTVFMGPIADSVVNGFGKANTNMNLLNQNMIEMSNYLADVSTNYKAGDENAKLKVIGVDASGKIVVSDSTASIIAGGSTQAKDLMELGDRANNGDSSAQKEWLDKMAALVKPYCDKYGFPESVLLAQMIQESGWTKSTSWLNKNNNILNVNSEMWGSNDYKVSKDGVVNENASIPKWASNPKHASGEVSGGAYFENPHDASMRAYDCVEDCVEDYLALMVGYRPELNGSNVEQAIDGIKHYAEDANYSNALHNHINSYNLTQYDV